MLKAHTVFSTILELPWMCYHWSQEALGPGLSAGVWEASAYSIHPGSKRHTCCLSSCAVGHMLCPAGRSPMTSDLPCASKGHMPSLGKASETWRSQAEGMMRGRALCSRWGALIATGSRPTDFMWAPPRQWMLWYLPGWGVRHLPGVGGAVPSGSQGGGL